MDDDNSAAAMAAASAKVMPLLAPQLASLTNAIPGLLALGPNMEQLVTMGKAMYDGAMTIPSGAPAQANYIAGIQKLGDVMAQASKSAPT